MNTADQFDVTVRHLRGMLRTVRGLNKGNELGRVAGALDSHLAGLKLADIGLADVAPAEVPPRTPMPVPPSVPSAVHPQHAEAA